MSGQTDGGTVDDLTTLGWQQGSFVSGLQGLAVPFLRSFEDGDSVAIDQRLVKASERLVIASHPCDLARPPAIEPYAETLVCKTVKRSYLPRLHSSPRTFIIDDEAGLVAEAKYRMLIKKDALSRLNPEPWPSSEARRHDFERWLGFRYDRCAFSTFVNAEAVLPLQNTYARMVQDDPAMAFALKGAVREVRLVVDEDPTPARAHILVVIWPSITPRQADAVQALVSEFARSLNPTVIQLAGSPTTAPLQRVSAYEYLRTQQISLIQ